MKHICDVCTETGEASIAASEDFDDVLERTAWVVAGREPAPNRWPKKVERAHARLRRSIRSARLSAVDLVSDMPHESDECVTHAQSLLRGLLEKRTMPEKCAQCIASLAFASFDPIEYGDYD